MLEFPGFLLRTLQYLSEKVSFTGYLGLPSVTMTFKLAISEKPTIEMNHEKDNCKYFLPHIIIIVPLGLEKVRMNLHTAGQVGDQ